jgi:hypothetical protein
MEGQMRSDHLHLTLALLTVLLILRQCLVLSPGLPPKSVINLTNQFEHREQIECLTEVRQLIVDNLLRDDQHPVALAESDPDSSARIVAYD